MNTTETLRAKAIARLDRRVTMRLLGRFRAHLPEALVQRALVEAREEAIQSGWPLLVFPLLAEEIVRRMVVAISPEAMALAQAA